jgi:hypothetical protein
LQDPIFKPIRDRPEFKALSMDIKFPRNPFLAGP